MTYDIVQLNKYPRDRYNVLVPVTTMQAASSLQRITVSEVQLDTRQDSSNKGPSKDIYFERSCGAFAITKVGGMKLAAAANISIVSTEPGRTEGCQRCIEMARATGQPRTCGNCPHVHDVAVTVTIRVPEPSGGFRLMQATKEIDCTLEAAGMKDGANGQQYKRFLPHRTAMAESKAFMRAIRAALGLAGTYPLEELKKPFVVARMVPNLDAPEIKQAVAQNYLQSMGMLFEAPAANLKHLEAPQQAETVEPYEDEAPGAAPWEQEPEPADSWSEQPEYGPADYDDRTPPQRNAPPAIPQETPRAPQGQPNAIRCTACGREITGGTSRKGRVWTPEDVAGYSQRNFGRVLCTSCQEKVRGGQR